jgi:hypothetical protein
MVVGLAVVVISERRAGLPRSATCDDVDPGGTRLRSAPPPTTRDAAGGRAGVRDGEVISPAFRPVSAEAVYCEDLADPFVVVDGTLRRRYLAYGTNTEDDHVPVLLSGGILRSESIAEGLPRLPAWSTPGAVWAPSVLRRDDVFVLYYATTHVVSGRQCISRATASQSQGPFEDHSEGPLVCPTELGGAIDPSPFVAEDGATYLLWKADGNCCGMPTRIFIQPLSDDGLEVAGPPRELLGSTLPWEAGVVEAPAMVEHDGAVYLFYSGNAWNSASYAVGYARCDTPLGPCRKPLEGPWLASSPEAAGPGGQEFFTDRGALHMIFGAWLNGVVGYDSGSFRSLYTLEVSFRDGVPVVAE